MIHVNLIRALLLFIYCAYILRSRTGLIFRALIHKVAIHTIWTINVVSVKDPDTPSPPFSSYRGLAYQLGEGVGVLGWRILTKCSIEGSAGSTGQLNYLQSVQSRFPAKKISAKF